jgi:hypothetical protein
MKNSFKPKKTDVSTPFRQKAKRLLDHSCIMDSSGEPVSKYRVKVFFPGRPEFILFSGAPTYLGHRSFFFEQQL